MNHSNRFNHLLLTTVFFLLQGNVDFVMGENARPAAISPPTINYSETAAEPVIEYNLVHHMLAEPDPEPLLRIYGNGRVHVHYPAYMTRAGDYELQLNQPELQALLHALATDGIIDFDPAKTRSRRQQLGAQQRAANGSMLYISDSSDTVIDIRLNEYQKGPDTARVLNLKKRFVWPDLKQDARRFPQLGEITNANNAAQRLETLLHRDDLVKIR
ncbi:MAG: hypothetical protein ABF297_16010 [Thiogranum sp.]